MLWLDATTGEALTLLGAGPKKSPFRAFLGLPVPGEILGPPQGGGGGEPGPGPGQGPGHGIPFHPPTDLEGIGLYLSSGLIPELPPDTAKRLALLFGGGTLSVLASMPEKLTRFKALAPKAREAVIDGFQAFRRERSLSAMLANVAALGPAFACLLLKELGPDAEARLLHDPIIALTPMGPVPLVALSGLASLAKDPQGKLMEGAILSRLLWNAREGRSSVQTESLLREAAALLRPPKGPLASESLGGPKAAGPGREAAAQPPAAQAPGGPPGPGEALTGLPEDYRDLMAGLKAALGKLSLGGKVAPSEGDSPGEAFAQLSWVQEAEKSLAQDLWAISKTPRTLKLPPFREALAGLPGALSLSRDISFALELSFSRKALLVDSAPGLAPMVLARALARLFGQAGARVAVATQLQAEADRLAKKLQLPVSSLGGLLGWSDIAKGYTRGRLNRLELDLLVVMGAGLSELATLSKVVGALPPEAGIVLIGDRFQPGRSEPGDVFDSLIGSKTFPAVRLGPGAPARAKGAFERALALVREGKAPIQETPGLKPDFYYVAEDDPEAMKRKALRLLMERVPKRLGLRPGEGSLIVTTAKDGPLGPEALNRAATAAFLKALAPLSGKGLMPENIPAPPKAIPLEASGIPPGGLEAPGLGEQDPQPSPWLTMSLRHGTLPFVPGQRIIMLRDHPDLGLRRGDCGLIQNVGPGELRLDCLFGEQGRTVLKDALLDIAPAWALPLGLCHNAYFPAVLVTLAPYEKGAPDRRELFLALSRGRSLAVLLGPRDALARALASDDPKPCTLSRLDAHLGKYKGRK
ncbi:MAG: AAA family ATPase [Deltaproteobacteria bacterium]|nr:AAA family ATPase [Deltaproteobacteria bacterium]